MDFIDGETLDDFLHESKSRHLPEEVARVLFQKVLFSFSFSSSQIKSLTSESMIRF